MGFTPLEGLMMGTRSGDLDPTLPGFLARKEGVEIAEVETWLNTCSGLLGVSERSSDMRELLEAAGQGDAGAELAVAMFCYRVRKYIAAYLAVLNGADAILFGGGIGENAPEVRARICA
jgi:acetate kinase